MSNSAPACGLFARRFLNDEPGMRERFGDPFRPLEPECRVIQFERPLTPTQLERAGELVADRPDVQLYVYFDASRDLNFLRYFPNLRRLQVALYKLEKTSAASPPWRGAYRNSSSRRRSERSRSAFLKRCRN